jgi:glycosyltransferase involved in cell wall biosynthesis
MKNRPDAVHSITPKAGLLAMTAAYLSNVPLRIHTFTGQVWSEKKGFKKSVLKFFDFLISRLSTFNIIDSPSQRDFLVAQKVLPLKKSIVFGNGSVSGVDLNKFKSSRRIYLELRRKLSIHKNAFVFIYLGRLNKDKGILDLANAFSKIRNDKAYLIVVGPDELDFGSLMKKIAGINQDRIKVIGFSKKPYLYLAASDVLCLPSYREGFGSVIIEAAAMGLPALASNIYGITDAVINRQTGLLHKPRDPKAILKCMNFCLLNKVLIRQYGLAAKKRCMREFNADILSKHWLDFYLRAFQKK